MNREQDPNKAPVDGPDAGAQDNPGKESSDDSKQAERSRPDPSGAPSPGDSNEDADAAASVEE
ncbi:MAG: hypothetical protein H0U16_01265 [Actinobacteria bacterium]|nr:hypothetical protein [Actinomycetota bacterium]